MKGKTALKSCGFQNRILDFITSSKTALVSALLLTWVVFQMFPHCRRPWLFPDVATMIAALLLHLGLEIVDCGHLFIPFPLSLLQVSSRGSN